MSKISSLNIFVATTPKHIFDIFFDFRTQKKPGLSDFFSDSEGNRTPDSSVRG